MAEERYKIVRYHQEHGVANRVMRHNLTLDEAQAHCRDPETSSSTATSAEARAYTERFGEWFDGYADEDNSEVDNLHVGDMIEESIETVEALLAALTPTPSGEMPPVDGEVRLAGLRKES